MANDLTRPRLGNRIESDTPAHLPSDANKQLCLKYDSNSLTHVYTLAHSNPIKMSIQYFPCFEKAGVAVKQPVLIHRFGISAPEYQGIKTVIPLRQAGCLVKDKRTKPATLFGTDHLPVYSGEICVRNWLSLSNCLM